MHSADAQLEPIFMARKPIAYYIASIDRAIVGQAPLRRAEHHACTPFEARPSDYLVGQSGIGNQESGSRQIPGVRCPKNAKCPQFLKLCERLDRDATEFSGREARTATALSPGTSVRATEFQRPVGRQ